MSCVFIHSRCDDLSRVSRARCSFATAAAAEPQTWAARCHIPVARTSQGSSDHRRITRCFDVNVFPGIGTSWPVEATRRMNRMYRRQRHIYDGTRRILPARAGPADRQSASRRRRECAGDRLRNRQEPGACRPALSGHAVLRHRYFDGDADVGDLSHFATRSQSPIRVAHGDGTAFNPQIRSASPGSTM